jgi:DNA mismatch repair protein MutL
MPIRILPDDVASQIAAGEVIERPASVVKELLENAVDAGTHQVTIQIADAGRRLVEVADDGMGIPASELEVAVARHATSKLRSAADLFHITTLGFRGEALASIASVSHFTLTARTQDSPIGARLHVEGGKVGLTEQAGGPVGTTVRVEDLFYNVPARLKFLKRDQTERQQIDGLVTRYALAYPSVRLHLFHDGRPALQTSGNGNRREVLANLYGVETARQMLEVSYEAEGMSVEGYISPVALTRSNRREITFFVNGRWVQDNSLSAALLQAYHTLLMVGRYPMAVLFVSLPPEEVDVNVHPAKAEVRFRTSDAVFSAVQRAVKRALLAYSPVPAAAPASTWQRPFSAPGFQNNAAHSIDLAWGMAEDANRATDEKTGGELDGSGEKISAPGLMGANASGRAGMLPEIGGLPLLRLVGQVGTAYIVAEGPDGLYLIDQHAAHERVLFERFMAQRSGTIAAQTLLEPVLVQLQPSAASLLQGQTEVLERLGFHIEPFGPNTFRVRAIPALLVGVDPAAAVRVVVEDFEEDEAPLQSQIEAKIIARVCKRAAVKAGHVLSVEEQRALLRDLETCQSPRTCPHGRPTMIHLSVDLLERQFGRKGAR